MTTLLESHSACLTHETPEGHPECAARLRAVLGALQCPEFAGLLRVEAPLAPLKAIQRVHPESHINAVLSMVPEQGFSRVDADTAMSPGSGEAALRAAGAVIDAVDRVMAGEAENAFCAVRPPGHHAEPEKAMGFCLFNNIAVAAQHLRAEYHVKRVAVVDFDVHHGNGTQAAFWDERDLVYISTHQSPLYPGTGRMDERGAHGNILNLPMRPGAGSDIFRETVESAVIPVLEEFQPEFLLISAGFDAHQADPLGGLGLTTADYGWVTGRLVEFARIHLDGRIVSALEGGYDLDALAEASAAHVRALMSGAA
ncbi:histone deacetylase family protein [Tepidicaulis sp. LMO-SS28]|uniref:histone deacetylase family protein n=1 Tax=Tepidicaulis sp. LMO-SS28 TaxID=3447455 RepID=UPI003EE2D700